MTPSDYMGCVARLPCCICFGAGIEVHHCIHERFSQRKASDFETIPLCAQCHRTLHADKKAWASAFGFDHGFIPQTRRMVLGAEWESYSICHATNTLKKTETKEDE